MPAARLLHYPVDEAEEEEIDRTYGINRWVDTASESSGRKHNAGEIWLKSDLEEEEQWEEQSKKKEGARGGRRWVRHLTKATLGRLV